MFAALMIGHHFSISALRREPSALPCLGYSDEDRRSYLRTKGGFTLPPAPIGAGTLGMPRLIRSAVSMSSRRCLSLTAATMSSDTL